MKIDKVRNLHPVERFFYFVQERESIRLRKEAGEPKPWTDDVIMSNYRFCNVRRMDDKVSNWLYDNWYCPNMGHKNMLGAIVMARHFNLPSTLEAIGFPKRWNPNKVGAKLRALKPPIFNGAYMVRGNDGVDKVATVVDYTTAGFMGRRKPKIDTSSMEASWRAILPMYGMGSFMAGQVVADARWAIEGTWEDCHDWAPMGPGSKRGMNRLYSRDIREPMAQEDFLAKLKVTASFLRSALPKSIWGRLELMDYQNCMCEFDKYCRALFNEGRPKQRYQGT